MADPTAQYVLPSWIDKLSVEYAVKLLLFGFYGGTAPTGGAGIPVTPSAAPSGTLSIFAKTAGQTETIPVGAFQIGIIFLTGTGTIGGVDWPVGVPFNIEARTAATIAVVCANPGTARINYLT